MLIGENEILFKRVIQEGIQNTQKDNVPFPNRFGAERFPENYCDGKLLYILQRFIFEPTYLDHLFEREFRTTLIENVKRQNDLKPPSLTPLQQDVLVDLYDALLPFIEKGMPFRDGQSLIDALTNHDKKERGFFINKNGEYVGPVYDESLKDFLSNLGLTFIPRKRVAMETIKELVRYLSEVDVYRLFVAIGMGIPDNLLQYIFKRETQIELEKRITRLEKTFLKGRWNLLPRDVLRLIYSIRTSPQGPIGEGEDGFFLLPEEKTALIEFLKGCCYGDEIKPLGLKAVEILYQLNPGGNFDLDVSDSEFQQERNVLTEEDLYAIVGPVLPNFPSALVNDFRNCVHPYWIEMAEILERLGLYTEVAIVTQRNKDPINILPVLERIREVLLDSPEPGVNQLPFDISEKYLRKLRRNLLKLEEKYYPSDLNFSEVVPNIVVKLQLLKLWTWFLIEIRRHRLDARLFLDYLEKKLLEDNTGVRFLTKGYLKWVFESYKEEEFF